MKSASPPAPSRTPAAPAALRLQPPPPQARTPPKPEGSKRSALAHIARRHPRARSRPSSRRSPSPSRRLTRSAAPAPRQRPRSRPPRRQRPRDPPPSPPPAPTTTPPRPRPGLRTASGGAKLSGAVWAHLRADWARSAVCWSFEKKYLSEELDGARFNSESAPASAARNARGDKRELSFSCRTHLSPPPPDPSCDGS